MQQSKRRQSDRALRARMRSPGRPPVARREDRQRFWAAIAKGLTSEDAGIAAGISPAVGTRWFRESGGMPTVSQAPAVGPLSLLRRAGGNRAPARPRLRRTRDRQAPSTARHRRSRGNCDGMPRPAAVPWTTEPRLPSGMPIGVLGARKAPSSPSMMRCGNTCKTVSQAP